MPPDDIELIVTAAEEGERIDKMVSARGVASRSALKRWLDDGRLTVDGVVAAPKTRLWEGQTIVVRPAPPEPSKAIPQDLPLEILHQDDDVVVVFKPAGLVVHPAPGHPDGTLVNALLHHVTFEEGGDPMRPGIVHRLDKDTSGVMVVAKRTHAREHMMALFAAHDIERRYDAIVVGAFVRATTFSTLHGRHPSDRKRFTSKVDEGKHATTHVRPVEQLTGAALVQCTLETGRTHQIRVHLADHHHAVLGDHMYGRTPKDPVAREAAQLIGRQALHAAVLGFAHPTSGETLRFEREPPEDFQAALTHLRG